jgi:hypothetical protein
MSFILRNHRDRYRQRARQDLYRGSLIIISFIMAILLGYVGGQKRHSQEMRYLKQQNEELKEVTSSSEQKVTHAQANLQTLMIKYKQLDSQYNRDVPKGDLGLLTALVKEQLDKGLAVERMVQIIRAAQPPRNCTPAISKRFILSTPAYKGPESAVTFADGTVTLSGSGESSINSKQEKEAWYDPGKPVSVTFTIIGGKKEVKSGLLPLHHTIILRNKEYRFTISEGPRSFIVISSDSCDYIESVLNSSVYSKSNTDN